MSRKNRRIRVAMATVFLLPSAATAMAAGEAVQSQPPAAHIAVSDAVTIFEGRMSLGYLSGEATELAYEPSSGYKVSELQWETDQVLMLGLGGSVQPMYWLRFNGDIRFKVTDGENSMNDYDYLAPGWDWTHWSQHNDVELSAGTIVDFNVEFPFFRAGEGFSFSGFLGYRGEEWEWEARGGEYVYSSATGFRDVQGSFPAGDTGITYEQTFHTPYIGLGFASQVGRLDFRGRIIGSVFVQAKDRDQHHWRNLVFEEEFEDGDMLGMDIAVAYSFTPSLAMTMALQYQEYFETKGTAEIIDLQTGRHTFISGDAVGMDNAHTTWSLGMRYLF